MKYKGDEVIVQFTEYYDGNLAMCLQDEDNCPYATVTVNIPDEDKTNERCAFIDINNCGERIIDWLLDNKFGKPTGEMAFSGFCVYPEFEFTQEVIDEYKVTC